MSTPKEHVVVIERTPLLPQSEKPPNNLRPTLKEVVNDAAGFALRVSIGVCGLSL